MIDKSILPAHWEVKKLGEVCDFEYGKALKKELRDESGESNVYGSNGIVGKHSQSIIEEPCIIVGRKGAAGEVHLSLRPSWPIDTTYFVRQRPTYDLKFFYYQLKALQLNSLDKSTAIPGLNRNDAYQKNIVLPPLSEQQEIVAKIEELFSELDKGKEQLETALKQLKVYRQAVLKWAFEGRFTNSQVKADELPEGWKWVKMIEISNKITDGEHFRPKTQADGIAFLSAKDVKDNGVSFDNPLFISEETAAKALQRCNPEKGDILIVSRGATVGRMCIVNTEEKFCLLGSVILIKANDKINNKYLNYVLKSPFANQKLISASGATAQQAIYLRDLKNIQVPLAPLEEQYRIVQEIESRLSVCDKVEETITKGIQQSKTLRQSILKKAFEGKLVNLSN